MKLARLKTLISLNIFHMGRKTGYFRDTSTARRSVTRTMANQAIISTTQRVTMPVALAH